MKLCRVIGSVWGGKEASSLAQRKLLRVQEVCHPATDGAIEVAPDGPAVPLKRGITVALDQLGAGIGEYVLVAHGSRVRDLTVGAGVPVKDVVVAIVDAAHVDGALLTGEVPA